MNVFREMIGIYPCNTSEMKRLKGKEKCSFSTNPVFNDTYIQSVGRN